MSLDAFPQEWITTSISEINDYTPRSVKPADSPDKTFELYSVPAYPDGHPEIQMGEDIGSSKQIVEYRDVLICKINPRINRVWHVNKAGAHQQIASSEWIVIRQKEIEERYIIQYFKYFVFRDLLCSDVSGVGGSLTRAQPKKVATYQLPLPPLAEQREVADRLDTLLAQVDTLKGRLDALPAILKRFRQSVLAAAVSGKLTEEWRGNGAYKEDNDITIPTTWSAQAAKTICKKVQSGSTPRDKPFDQKGTIPFLKVYNIVDQKINFDYRPQFITEETHSEKLKRSIALPDDILMNIVGPPLGKVAMLTNQYPQWNFNQAITLFRADTEKLIPKFLYLVLCEGALVRKVMPDTKGSVGQINISLTQCRESIVPVPPFEEQGRIVRRVEQLFAFADQVEQRVKEAQDRVNNLTQSILAKAFRGELTAEWREQHPELISGENSASALLARIQAERAAQAPVKRTRKKKASA